MRSQLLARLSFVLVFVSLARISLASRESGAVRRHGRMAWDRFPVRVYFVRDNHYSNRRREEAIDGFSYWNDATEGWVKFKVLDSPSEAQVFVRFDPNTNDGHITMRSRNRSMTRADMVIGVADDEPV